MAANSRDQTRRGRVFPRSSGESAAPADNLISGLPPPGRTHFCGKATLSVALCNNGSRNLIHPLSVSSLSTHSRLHQRPLTGHFTFGNPQPHLWPPRPSPTTAQSSAATIRALTWGSPQVSRWGPSTVPRSTRIAQLGALLLKLWYPLPDQNHSRQLCKMSPNQLAQYLGPMNLNS